METEQNNRMHLLDVSLKLFVRLGYDGIGVQQIVEEAGVTKPTLYHYFGNKIGLLDALLREQLAELITRLERACDYRHDLPFTLSEIARTLFTFSRANPDLVRLHLSLWFAPQDSEAFRVSEPLHRRQYELIENVFLLASEDHGNMRGRHTAYTVTFLGMLNTYVGMALNGHAELDEPLVYKAVHQFMHGIFS